MGRMMKLIYLQTKVLQYILIVEDVGVVMVSEAGEHASCRLDNCPLARRMDARAAPAVTLP